MATLSATGISGASAGAAITYGYESSRLTSVATSDGYAASQAWTADGRHPGSTVHTKGSTTVTMTRTHDALGRLTFAGKSGQASTAYEYNALDHRTKATAADGSYFGYSYDGLGQVTSATRHWADDSAVPGEWHGYGYDGAGNRYKQTLGAKGTTHYTLNALNQLTGATFYGEVGVTGMSYPPGEEDIVGVFFDNIWGNVERSENGWFYASGWLNNTAAAKWVQVHVDVRHYDMIIRSTGHQFVPKRQVALLHDDDGNKHFAGTVEAEGVSHKLAFALVVVTMEVDFKGRAEDAKGVVIGVKGAVDDGGHHAFGVMVEESGFEDAFAGAGFADNKAKAALLGVDEEDVKDVLLMGEQGV